MCKVNYNVREEPLNFNNTNQGQYNKNLFFNPLLK